MLQSFTMRRDREAQDSLGIQSAISRAADTGVTYKIKHESKEGAKERIIHRNMLLNFDELFYK